MGMAAILVMWPGTFAQTFIPPSHRSSIWNFTLIGPVVSEEKMFKECGWRRVTEAYLSYKLTKWTFSSGELKKDILPHWMAAHAHLKNEFTEDEKSQNLMTWPQILVFLVLNWTEKSKSYGLWSIGTLKVFVYFIFFTHTLFWPASSNTIWAASWQNQQNGMCAQWNQSKSSLYAQWVAKDPSFHHLDSEDSDQTRWMPRLIRVFARSTCHFVGFVTRQLNYEISDTSLMIYIQEKGQLFD